MNKHTPRWLALWLALAVAGAATAAPRTECIVPSKPGGAMDLTCKLVQRGLQADGAAPAHISYLPGGVGAVAWHTLVSQRRAEPDTLVAFSGGSLLNLAQGKFGMGAGAVRWVAALGIDYGMLAVPANSPYHTLGELMAALKQHPDRVLIGVSGTVGGQDWLKVALLARLAGVDPKALRFVALEGGGEIFTALQAGYVQVMSGDASEATLNAAASGARVLAVLSERRLPGALAAVPTAREQGYDVVWPLIRGVWMGPQVGAADYGRWVGRFDRLLVDPEFVRQRAAAGLYPFGLTGAALTDYVNRAVREYRERAAAFGLVR